MNTPKKVDASETFRIPEPKKKRYKFLHTKTFWVVAVIVAIGGIWFFQTRFADQGPFYETAEVTRGDVIRTVEVTGEVVPEARLSLGFKNSGNLEQLFVRIGDVVKAGDVLAELEARDIRFSAERARASLAIAQANLNARLAGSPEEAILIAKAGVVQAEAAYEKAQVDLETAQRTVEDNYQKAQLAYDLASQNLTNSGATAEQSVVTSFENLRASLQASLGPMRTGLIEGDAVIGIDNSAANDNYESLLGIFDRPALEEARRKYPLAKTHVNTADSQVRALHAGSSQQDILSAALSAREALEDVQLYLTYVQKTLAGTITNSNLSQAQLDALQSGISSNISSVGAQLSSVVASYETARNSDLTKQTTFDQLKNAYKTAELNLAIAESDRETQIRTAQANVDIQAAGVSSSKASLSQTEAPPREVDVASLRAQVFDAQTAYSQALEKLQDVSIFAPLGGVVTDIVPERGELVSAGNPVIRMISADSLTVEALVPEADITKVAPGQTITITLDAYGDDIELKGSVISENADQTVVQDAIYYTTYVDFDPLNLDVKSGMTANLTVLTGERSNVLFIPSRSLRLNNGDTTVRVQKGERVEEVEIEIGLRGDEGRVEILSGLEEGDNVITGELTADEARAQ